jgi:hypothetical protein
MITLRKITAIIAVAFIALAFAGCDDPMNPESEPVSKPTVSPAPGEYDAAPTVTLASASEGAEIYYTIGEGDPTNGTKYTGPFTLSPFPATLKAIAVKDDVVSAVLTAEYTKSGEQNPSFGSGLYASGSYWDGDYYHAGYWRDGTWHALATPSGAVSSMANQIAVSGTDVYITGNCYTATNAQSGYWLNGVWYTLDTSTANGRTDAAGIVVINDSIYVAGTRYEEANLDLPGMFNKRYGGYWLNGVWHDLPVPDGTVSDIVGICIDGGNVYIGGYYQIINANYEMHPCYWRNGQRHDFPNSVDRVIVDITVSGGKVYAAELHSGYWIDDNWYTRGDADDNPRTSKECIGVIGSNVYLAGWGWSDGQAGYWLNENWSFLAVPAGAQSSSVLSITVSGNNIYFIGYYSDLAGSHACYWKNGILQVLTDPAGTASSSVAAIAVVL